MKVFSARSINIIALVISCALLISAFFFEYVRGIQPCMLCMLQRLLFALIGIIVLVAVFHNPKPQGIRIYGVMTLLLGIVGIAVAGRQVWLQMQPPQANEICAPGLNYMLANYPLGQTIMTLLHGSDDCAKVSFQFLGMSLAGWTLVFFILFILLALVQIFRKTKNSFN